MVTLFVIVPVLPDPVPGFAGRKGNLITIHELKRITVGDSVIIDHRLVSSSGLQVDMSIRKRHGINTPQPLTVLLGGLRRGNRAVDFINRSINITVAVSIA